MPKNTLGIAAQAVTVLMAAGVAFLPAAPPPSATRPAASAPASGPAAGGAFPNDYPTSQYVVRDIEGWTVRLHKDLLGPQEALGRQITMFLQSKLLEVKLRVPAEALAVLQTIPIWVDREGREGTACYHWSARWLADHGRNPDKAMAVQISSPKRAIHFARWQPAMLLHELAHGYHQRVMGRWGKQIEAAYASAMASGRYEKVSCVTAPGKPVRAYACNNAAEYFAETTEAYFLLNDFYPHFRAQLEAHDPPMHRLLEEVWGVKPPSPPPAATRSALVADDAPSSAPAEAAATARPTSRPATGPVIRSWEEMRDVRVPWPTEFASVFSFGYMRSPMPKDDKQFETFLIRIREGGFNVVLCDYTEARLEACRRHGVKMMVDLLAPPYRFFTNPDGVQALCLQLRGDRAVWGYDLWNDKFGSRGEHGPGLNERMVRIRTWDPTHPTFAGTYRTIGIEHLANADCFGYYDYHWTRGRHLNFLHLTIYRYWAMRRSAFFLRWVQVRCGPDPEAIYRRALYTVNTSIACGLKGALWFLGQDMLDLKTMDWTPAGKAICRVNKDVMPLRAWIMKIGNPTTVGSTPVKGDSGEAVIPKSLPPLPKGFWLEPTGGEFLMGVFQDAQNRDYAFCANHSITAEQIATIKSSRPVAVEQFDRTQERWVRLPVKDGTFTFRIPPSGGELLRFEAQRDRDGKNP